MKTRAVLFTLLLALMFHASAHAQTVNVKITGFDTGKFPLVRAFVSVTDASGRAVQSLTRAAFKLTEEGLPVEIVAVNASDDAIHVGLIIDRSGSMNDQNKLNDAKTAASAFVDEMRTQDEAFLMTFDTGTAMLQDFTNDRNVLKQAIGRISPGGSTALYEATYIGAEKFTARKQQRKNALIVLTDGLNNSGRRSINEAINEAKENTVTIYTIGLGRDAERTGMENMATATGGKYFYAPGGEQLRELYRLIAEQLQKEYMVEFRSPRALADGTRRNVNVVITLPSGETRTGDGRYVAGLLFNRINANWIVGILLGMMLFVLGVAPAGWRLMFRSASASASPAQTPATPVVAPPVQQPTANPVCPRCGQPARVGARFCAHCQQPLAGAPPPPASSVPAQRCPQCGAALRSGAKFCGTCRYKLS